MWWTRLFYLFLNLSKYFCLTYIVLYLYLTYIVPSYFYIITIYLWSEGRWERGKSRGVYRTFYRPAETGRECRPLTTSVRPDPFREEGCGLRNTLWYKNRRTDRGISNRTFYRPAETGGECRPLTTRVRPDPFREEGCGLRDTRDW